MIEINLLPPEYRPTESHNVPLIATILGGVVLVCGLFFFWMSVTAQVAELQRRIGELGKQKTDLEAEAKKIDGLKEEIERQKSRQQTIIEISQSKVMWSQKLEQLAQILGGADFKSRFWISSLGLSKAAGGRGGANAGTLSLKVSGLGYDMREVAKLRDAIQQDQNFFYHFVRLDSATVNRVELTNFRNATEKMEFEIKLPVQAGTVAAPPARGRGRGR